MKVTGSKTDLNPAEELSVTVAVDATVVAIVELVPVSVLAIAEVTILWAELKLEWDDDCAEESRDVVVLKVLIFMLMHFPIRLTHMSKQSSSF